MTDEDVVSFNGVNLKSYNQKKYLSSWLSVEDYLHRNPHLPNCEIFKLPFDELSLNKSGTLRTKAIKRISALDIADSISRITASRDFKCKLYHHAFLQLLRLLQIPITFAKRIPHELLLQIVNSLLSEKYDRLVGVRYLRSSRGELDGIALCSSESRTQISVYDFFARIIAGDISESTNLNMTRATFDGLTASAQCHFSDLVGDMRLGIELFYCDGMSCLPTVSGVILCKNGYAIIKDLSISLDINSGQSKNQVLKNAESAVVKVYSSIDKFKDVKMYLNSRTLDENEILSLRERSSKMMRRPLDLWHGMVLMDVFNQALRYQNKKDLNILEKRRAGIFAGWLIENKNDSFLRNKI